MSHAVILTGQTAASDVRYAVGTEATVTDAGTATGLRDLPDPVSSAETLTIILPGTVAATRRLNLPVRGDRALADAATLAFEDILAEPVDRFHFAFGALNENGQRLVSAVPRAWIEDWMGAIAAAGLDPDVVTIDHLALHGDGADAVVYSTKDHLAAQLPDGGVSGDPVMLMPLVAEMVRGLSVFHVMTPRSAADISGEELLLNDDRTTGAYFLTSASAEGLASFRRGEFAKRRDWMGVAREWRVAAGFMVACGVLWLASTFVDAVKYDRAADALQSEARSTFSRAYPDVIVRDLRRQAAQRAQPQIEGGRFLALSADLTTAIQEAASVQLTGMTYTDDSELIAELRFPDAATLERVKTTLEQRGVQTREDGNLRREDNGDYSGRLYLGGPA